MEFQYDRYKSVVNRWKHGIDFEEAKELWNNVTLTIPSSAEVLEPRWLVIGRIRSKHCTAIVTERSPAKRIISVRRSRKLERDLYEKSRKDRGQRT